MSDTPPPGYDVQRVIEQIDDLMSQLARLRSDVDAARDRELKPRDLGVERRRGERRQGLTAVEADSVSPPAHTRAARAWCSWLTQFRLIGVTSLSASRLP